MSKVWPYRSYGIPDELFERIEEIPMTKEEIRVITLSKARLKPGDIVVDVGSGTGSITVEAAMLVQPNGLVYAVDHDERAVELTKRNCQRFGVLEYVKIIKGHAPEALLKLPHFDCAIIGGGSEVLREILEVCKIKGCTRVVINAILIETANRALESLKELGFKDIEVTYIFVAKGKQTRFGTALLARNPVMVISSTLGDKHDR
jgi:cobalt-precorrin-6B (C15)-methyltransferase